jgi:hypothetical protein
MTPWRARRAPSSTGSLEKIDDSDSCSYSSLRTLRFDTIYAIVPHPDESASLRFITPVKKYSKLHMFWLERRRSNAARRRRILKAKRANLPSEASGRKGFRRVRYQAANRTGIVWARSWIRMPEEFCLETNYEETARCLAGVRERLSAAVDTAARAGRIPRRPSRVMPSYYDFTTIKRCTPAAALILARKWRQVNMSPVVAQFFIRGAPLRRRQMRAGSPAVPGRN